MKLAFTYFLLLANLFFSTANADDEKEVVKCGWYHWDPYQYIDENKTLTGLDVALVKAIFASSGIVAQYDENAKDTWRQNQDDVRFKIKDVAAGAFKTPGREEIYYLTKPYRYEWNSLYVRTDEDFQFEQDNVSDLIEFIKSRMLRVGVIKGYKYTSDVINDFVAEQNDQKTSLLVESKTEESNFSKLVSNKVDILISDRLVGARILWKKKLGGQISELPIKLPAKPIHLLIHKSEVDEKINEHSRRIRDAFNKGIDELSQKGEIKKIIGEYLFPVLMNITVQREWFYMIDIIGAFFFAIAGLLIARDHKYDIFGTFIMTSLLATGGGLMRDLIVGRQPAVLRSPDYAYIVVVVSIIGFLLCRIHFALLNKYEAYNAMAKKNKKKCEFVREVIEAIAIGAYTIIGVGVAVEMKVAPLWLWGPVLGCLTSCGGGLLANALRHGDEIKTMRGAIDPECSLIWGAFFSGFLIWQADRLNPNEVLLGVIITLVGTTLTMLLAKKRKLNSPCMNHIDPQFEAANG